MLSACHQAQKCIAEYPQAFSPESVVRQHFWEVAKTFVVSDERAKNEVDKEQTKQDAKKDEYRPTVHFRADLRLKNPFLLTYLSYLAET